MQVWTIDHARVRETVQVGTLLQRELYKPVSITVRVPKVGELVICQLETGSAESVLNSAAPCTRESKFLHHPVKNILVDLFDYAEGVACKLNWTAKPGKLGGAFVHSAVHALLQERKSCH